MYGCYYTPMPLAKLLVKQFQISASKVVDLGVGRGALLSEAALRWPTAQLIGADRDPTVLELLRPYHPTATLLPIDVLLNNFEEAIGNGIRGCDVALCNPPYLHVRPKEHHRELLVKFGLEPHEVNRGVQAAAIFLAHLLEAVRPGGEVGVILPDGLLSGRDNAPLRRVLLTKHEVRSVIELPRSCFERTEALTHILILRKGGRTQANVPVCRADVSGEITATRHVPAQELEYRMDFNFYRNWDAKKVAQCVTLNDLGVKIIRGRSSGKDLRASNNPFLHTSDLPIRPSEISAERVFAPKEIIAEPGDILVARVGTRVLGRRALLKSGQVPISDCVYILRPPIEHRNAVWEAMMSPLAEQWFQAFAHGVCAQLISKADLLGFPIRKL